MADPDTCVAYLVRIDEGLAPVQRFLGTYASHDSGLPHRLLVLRRGFQTEGSWIPFASAFDGHGLHYEILDVASAGYDLGAYREAVGASNDDYICFLNTFSEVLCDGWLAHLHRSARQATAGLVGATGSYESAYSASLSAHRMARAQRRVARSVRGWLRTQRLRSEYEPFPNPHVRTNGFMLRRPVALALRWGPYRTKNDALRGESGRSGLSRQAQALGLRNLVVGRDGRSYEPHDWPLGCTFRCRDQSNLMIADNRTRQYGSSPPEERSWLGRLAWGAQYQASAADSVERISWSQ
jgi:hypothetical protein